MADAHPRTASSGVATFYTLILTQIFSLIGSRMTGIAVGIWLFNEIGDASPLLIAAFFAELPGMVMGSITGILADRYDKRWVIMLGDAGQAIGTVLLLVTLATGTFALWHLYAAMLLQGIFAMIQAPASQSAITMLVPDNHRDRANGIRELGFPLAGVIAPVLVGLLYSIAGVVGVIIVDLVTFLVAIVVVSCLHIPKPPKSKPDAIDAGGQPFWRELLGGWLFLLRHRALWWLSVYIAFVAFAINGPLELAIPYLTQLTTDEAQLGLLLGIMNLGAFAGAGAIAIVGNIKQRVRMIMMAYTLLGVMLMAYGVVREPLLLAVVLFLLMFPLPPGNALYSSLLQTKTPPDMQGRVFAVTGQLFMLTTPFSFLITGVLVDNLFEPAITQPVWDSVAPLVGREPGAGMGLLLVLTGVSVLIATALIFAMPHVRHLETDMPDYHV